MAGFTRSTRNPYSCLNLFVFIVTSLHFSSIRCTAIRGVALTKLPFYNPAQNFSCLDGSRLLPFSSVNDDYCDCEDGSDEPGTAACPNGSFFCINAGFKGESILSSRVNDGVCDCCDGSDEYEDDVQCTNTCREKGREALEKLKKQREETEKGYKVKMEEVAKGKVKRAENQQKLETLKILLETQKANLDEVKVAKEKAEGPETEAKDAHQKEWEAEKDARKKEAERKAMETAFQTLDIDDDGKLTSLELQANPFMDADMADTEAKELLSGNDEVTLESFSSVWDALRIRYKAAGRESVSTDDSKETGVPKEPSSKADGEDLKPLESPSPLDTSSVDDPDADKDEDEEEEEEEQEEEKQSQNAQTSVPASPEESAAKEEDEMPDYDQETKRLMLIADQARSQYEAAQAEVKKTEGQISDIERQLGHDFGPHEEFSYMYGQCYELNDREYQYRLCPFNEAVQAPKGGGGDTSLGHWKGWVGTSGKYTRMRYDGGVGCWNGPARSTEVVLQCGPETQLMSATEPNRCEYVMEFKTPALCPDPTTLPHTHEEL